MPAERNTNQSRRLTAAGLIAVTAATLLMMAWAIFPTPAFADGTHVWGVDDNKQGSSANLPCASGGHWIFQFTGTVTAATLHVGGEDIPMSLQGGHFVADSIGPVATNTVVSVTWVGPGDGDFLTLSHCLGTTTTTTTTVPTTTTTVPTTTTTVPTTTTTVPTTTTTVPTTTTTVPTTTTTVPTTTTTVPTTTTTVPTTTTTVPTTVPGGGGGGGNTTVPTTTTTTTASPTVGPTTIHKSTTTTDEVLPTTVTPGGTAFTGVENVVPIGAIALMLMTSGSGLLWASSRRRRDDGSGDED